MTGPLSGIKIVDLSAVVSGPMACGLLADQGAEVVKVEPRQGDLTRLIGPAKGDISALFAAINRGKRSIVLDLKQPSAREVLRELIGGADVLVENFRPGAMARLGFAYEQVAAFNPGIVYLSISGFGQSGPMAHARVYDTVIQAVAGFAAAHPDRRTGEPELLQTLMCDKITALTAAQALTAALFERERAGGAGAGAGEGVGRGRAAKRGRKIELSMLDAAVSFLWPEAFYNHSFQDDPPAPVIEYGAATRLWRCRDGWVAIITPQDDEFAAMCRVLGAPELITDPRFVSIPTRRVNQPALRALLEPVVAARGVDELVAEFAGAGCPAGKVNGKAELPHDVQVRHNALLHDTEHPGLGRLRTPRAAAQFLGLPWDPQRLAPHLGEHTREVLRELGRGEAEIEALVAAGAAR